MTVHYRREKDLYDSIAGRHLEALTNSESPRSLAGIPKLPVC